ncbi:unnamed protein product [Absidia cylindrospora]
MRSTTIALHISSLNCNSLVKSASHTRQSSYLRFLRLQQPTIYTFQETHATESNIPTLNNLLQGTHTIWSNHCGIVSFSPIFCLEQIPTPCSRSILAKVTHPHHFYAPFYILTIYADAKSGRTRQAYFNTLLDLIVDYADRNIIDFDRLVITGDFNYDLHRPHLSSQTSLAWVDLLDTHFYNTMTYTDSQSIPTFQRGSSSSVIDYTYVSASLKTVISDSSILPLQPEWSDHSILSTSLRIGYSKFGPGLWRANPTYLNHPDFKDQLSAALDKFTSCASSSTPPQELWEDLKLAIQHLVKNYGMAYVPWRLSTLKALQRKRNRFLRSRPSPALRSTILPNIERLIHQLQQELSDIAALKAGVIWREKSERSAGYLKRVHQQRTTQQYISTLTPDVPGRIPTSSQPDQETIAHNFYQHLYTSTTVSPHQIDNYLANITFPDQITTQDRKKLLEPFTIESIQYQANRMTKSSSPGEDGFGYGYWSLIFSHSVVQSLATTVYNQALSDGLFPLSWQRIRVRLLPKKGALSSLRNWRPISLINCDAKIFTRLLTQRLAPILNTMINVHQTGFLPGRFIAENGLALQLLLEQAQLGGHKGIGLLLDQEKAYDRVHPLYLQKTMLAMGFPPAFVHSIQSLFFGNKVQININGYFTNDIIQQRGLRQGDPLSPLLFNIALEPFLLSIAQDHTFQGYPFGCDPMTAHRPPPNIKFLAYADDICVFLSTPTDFTRLQHHMTAYTQVSNAHFNQHKTEAFSLSGTQDDDWQRILESHDITNFYHRFSLTPFKYLGFRMCYTPKQRQLVCQNLLQTVTTQINIYSQRRLSIKGRTTIMNSLILSKVWYALRILVAPASFFSSLQRLISRFINGAKHPFLSYNQMCQPVANGGLGLLDPRTQQQSLQLRWITDILYGYPGGTFLHPILRHHLSLISGFHPDPRHALLFPETRSGPLTERSRTASLWFQAFDSLPVPLDLSNLSLSTCLLVPLHRLLVLPTSHWLCHGKHRCLPGSALFLYDSSQHSLRLRVPSEMDKPKLKLKRVYLDIFATIIDLQPWMWDFIGTPSDLTSPCSYTPLVDCYFDDPFWQDFTSKVYRYHQIPGSLPPYRFSSTMIKVFWSAPMHPHARTIWYKAINNKLPLQHFLAKLHPQDSRCIFCHQHEDRVHFLYLCPFKRPIWEAVLAHQLPLHFLQPTSYTDFIIHLRSPPHHSFVVSTPSPYSQSSFFKSGPPIGSTRSTTPLGSNIASSAPSTSAFHNYSHSSPFLLLHPFLSLSPPLAFIL